MNLPSRRQLFVMLCAVVVCVTYIVVRVGFPNDTSPQYVAVADRSHFLVDSAGCKIPNIDPFDISIVELIKKGKPLYCGDIMGLTYQIGNVVYVNKTVVAAKYRNTFKHCESDQVVRIITNSDNRYKFVPNKGRFKVRLNLKGEFTRIRCYNTTSKVIHYNFYAINIAKPEAEKRYIDAFPKHIKKHSVKHAFNVLLMGIDSVSRLNFIRHLNKTRNYLINKMGALDITGYNKVADNTFVNLVPILAGKYVPELPYDTERDKNKPFDEYDMIFKRFRASGYRTLFAEDDPYITTFNYIKEGFYKPPADDYLRPMSVAMENEKTLWKRDHCVHERGEHDIYTDYIYRFIKANTVAKRPYFSFSFLTRITHYWMNKAALADDHHFKFLRRIHKQQLLNNTIMFYFSDHGMRYGSIRDTYVGKMSARLPALYVYLPPSFRREYPKLYKNVVTNAHRLTTPFDIYETLRDILYFNDSVGRRANLSSRGISFFSEIPAARTCGDARIEPHWCACADTELISVNDSLVVKSASFLVEHFNSLLNDSARVCERLMLDRITAASKIVPDAKMLQYEKKVENVAKFNKKISLSVFYQISIMTSPGGGKFEATVKHSLSGNKMEMAGDVSRTNIYGKTSWCVNDSHLKYFCYCKKQKK